MAAPDGEWGLIVSTPINSFL